MDSAPAGQYVDHSATFFARRPLQFSTAVHTLAQQVYQQQKARLARRYGHVIAWWNARVAELRPANPFQVKNQESLHAARELFEQYPDQIPVSMWKGPSSPYNLPVGALYPYGLKSIQRMLETKNFSQTSPVPASQSNLAIAPEQAPDVEHADWATLLRGGHQSAAYRATIGILYGPGTVEHRLGMFLASDPEMSQQSVTAFLESLPDDISDDIESAGGWTRLVRQIDAAVLSALRDNPAIREQVMRQLQLSPQQATNMLRAIRWQRFMRTAALTANPISLPARRTTTPQFTFKRMIVTKRA